MAKEEVSVKGKKKKKVLLSWLWPRITNMESSIDAAKMGASVVIWDLGITDAITDKAREYPVSFVIPVKK